MLVFSRGGSDLFTIEPMLGLVLIRLYCPKPNTTVIEQAMSLSDAVNMHNLADIQMYIILFSASDSRK